MTGRGCASGRDCAEPGVQVPKEVPFCSTCLRAAKADIFALPDDYLDLANLIMRTAGHSDEVIARPKPGSRPNIDLGVDEHLRRLVWTIALIEGKLRDAQGLPDTGVGGVRPGFLTARAAAYLGNNIFALAILPPTWSYLDGLDREPVYRDGVDHILVLRQAHERVRAYVGLTDKLIKLPGACPGCNRPALLRMDGGDTVWCEACNRDWPYLEYRRYVALLLGVLPDGAK